MKTEEEAKSEIGKLRQKRQNATDDARITYLEGYIEGLKDGQRLANLRYGPFKPRFQG